MNFEKGLEPKKALEIGKHRPVKKGDTLYVWCHDFGEEIEVFALGNEFKFGGWDSDYIKSRVPTIRAVNVCFKKSGYHSTAYFKKGWETNI